MMISLDGKATGGFWGKKSVQTGMREYFRIQKEKLNAQAMAYGRKTFETFSVSNIDYSKFKGKKISREDYIVEKNKLASLDGDKPNGPPASGVHFEKKEDPQKDEKDGIRNRIKRFFQDLFTRNKPKELPEGEMEKEDEPKPEPQNPWKVDNIGNIEPIIKDDKKEILENNSKITSDDTNKDTERDE